MQPAVSAIGASSDTKMLILVAFFFLFVLHFFNEMPILARALWAGEDNILASISWDPLMQVIM